MCTISIRRDAGLLLTMNRDEVRTRGTEAPPCVHERSGGGVLWLAPTDTEKGGTWIGVNNRGVAACLLNLYHPEDRLLPPDPNRPTRGAIIPRLLSRGPIEQGLAWLRNDLDPTPFPSFSLFVLDRNAGHIFTWDFGKGLAHESLPEGWSMFASSALEMRETQALRRACFAEWTDNGAAFAGALPAFHLARTPGQESHSVLMDREISCTRSIAQIELRPDSSSACMRYWQRDAGQLEFAAPTLEASLPLTPSPGHNVAAPTA